MEGGEGSSSLGGAPSAYVLEGEHAAVSRGRRTLLLGSLASSRAFPCPCRNATPTLRAEGLGHGQLVSAHLARVSRGEPAVNSGPRGVEMRASTALLPVLVVGIVVAAAGPAFAQGAWSGSTPQFESDTRRAADEAEVERAARRASYGPVVYPKHMDGGERPDIKPAEPPIVYFDQNEA